MKPDIKITIQSETRCRIEGDFDDKALDDLLSFYKSNFWWKSQAARMGGWDGKTHLFHRHSGTFPIGILKTVKLWLKAQDIKPKVADRRTSPIISPRKVTTLGGGIVLRLDQIKAVEQACAKHRGIIHGATGSGKCLSPRTMVLLSDGRRVRANTIKVGDKLLSPQGGPRTVLSTTSGVDMMYEVRANRGDARFTCNSTHVLTVYDGKRGGVVVDVPLNEFRSWSTDRKRLARLVYAKKAVFDKTAIAHEVDPWLLGLWYGDTGKLPLRLQRKHASTPLQTGFTVRRKGPGRYVGFTLDGDGRFVLGNFLVTHNSEVAVAIVESLGRPITLFLTGRRKLAAQTRERFAKRLNVPLSDIGFIGNGKWTHSPIGIYIAIVATLTQSKFMAERKKLYHTCQLLMIDEHQHAASTSWYNTIIHCKARYRFGLTGTPIGRSDGADLMLRAVTGGIIARMCARDLVAQGILAEPTIYFTPVTQPRVYMTADDSWSAIYQKAVVFNDQRNAIIADYAKQLQHAGKKTLILVHEKAHGELLSTNIPNCKFIHGSLTGEIIDKAIRDLESGRIGTLVATSILDEGIDIPAVNAVVNAAGGKSVITTIQRIGRGLRKKADDNRLTVLDFMDETEEHLQQHSLKRIEVCKGEGFKTVLLDAPAHDLEARIQGGRNQY